MNKWHFFSLGIAAGLLAAVGFGFALSGQGGPSRAPSQLDPYAPPTAPAASQADGKLRAIVFGAHPDDCEISAGACGIKWSKLGHHVKFVSMTNGDIGHWQMAGGPLAQRRYAEVQAAARILGVTTDVVDNHDGELLPTLDNRRTATRLIRDWQADVIVAPRPNDYHPDHRYTGVIIQDSAYMVAVPYFCPDTPPVRGNPVFLYSADFFQRPNPFRADVAVAIDDVVEQKVDALAGMESQFYEGGALGYLKPLENTEAAHQARRDQVRQGFKARFARIADMCRDKLVELYGEKAGKQVKYAEAFEVCEYGRQPTKAELLKLFPFVAKQE